MKLTRILDKIPIWAVLLLIPLYGGVICTLELTDRHAFNRIEREFYLYDELHALQLRVIITSYEEQTPEQIGRLHQRYLRDGSFALLDEVEQKQSERIEELIRLCPTNCTQRLADCIRRSELRVRASYMAQIPFPFRGISRGMADYILCTDAE